MVSGRCALIPVRPRSPWLAELFCRGLFRLNKWVVSPFIQVGRYALELEDRGRDGRDYRCCRWPRSRLLDKIHKVKRKNPNIVGTIYWKQNNSIKFLKVRLQTVWTVRQHDTGRLSCLIAPGREGCGWNYMDEVMNYKIKSSFVLTFKKHLKINAITKSILTI